MKGAMPVPVENSQSVRPGSRFSVSRVPVGLRPISTVSPGLTCWRREVSGPRCTLMDRNSSPSSQGALTME